MSGSTSPYSQISLPPGAEYYATEIFAEKPGLNQGEALWYVATFEKAGRRFFMAECCTGGHVYAEGTSIPGQMDVLKKAQESLDAPDESKIRWDLRVVRKCYTPGCPNGEPLTGKKSTFSAEECLTCRARYVASCLFCGCPDPARYSQPTRNEMLDKSICFHCHHWVRLLKDETLSIRVSGHHYMLGSTQPGTPGSSHQGFSGQKFRIRFFDERDDIVTYNLFTQGKIPEPFTHWLPDNAQFLTST